MSHFKSKLVNWLALNKGKCKSQEKQKLTLYRLDDLISYPPLRISRLPYGLILELFGIILGSLERFRLRESKSFIKYLDFSKISSNFDKESMH